MGFFMSGGTQYADDPIVQKVAEALQRKVPQPGAGKPPGTKPASESTKPPTDDLD